MGVSVEPAGFVVHPRLSFIGATPDGLVGEDGLLEIKCPLHRLPTSIPDTYMAQVHTLPPRVCVCVCARARGARACAHWVQGGGEGRGASKRGRGCVVG